LITVFGCAQAPLARYVYQDGEYGVVGIPVNTYHDRLDVRVQAEELMARHFPDGYEIVRAEEVNEGERILDLGNRTELVSEPALKAIGQLIQLGKVDRTTSFAEKDKLQARECRIIYKKKPAHTPGGPGQFAAVASLSPPLYLDPNQDRSAPDRSDNTCQGQPEREESDRPRGANRGRRIHQNERGSSVTRPADSPF